MHSFVMQDLLPPVDSTGVFSKAVVMLLLIHCLLLFSLLGLLFLYRT